jgi:hypothetical protein
MVFLHFNERYGSAYKEQQEYHERDEHKNLISL